MSIFVERNYQLTNLMDIQYLHLQPKDKLCLNGSICRDVCVSPNPAISTVFEFSINS